MRATIIYHNPKCSKSRETLALLRDHGIEPLVVEYLKEPPDEQRLLELVAMLGGDARCLLRATEPAIQESGLGPDSSNEEIVHAIARNPILLERPIVVRGRKAAIGRPPQQVLAII